MFYLDITLSYISKLHLKEIWTVVVIFERKLYFYTSIFK